MLPIKVFAKIKSWVDRKKEETPTKSEIRHKLKKATQQFKAINAKMLEDVQ